MRTNYNYNYNYSVTTQNIQKPHSANPYSKPYQHHKPQNQSTAHYMIQHSVKYYPITQDEPAFKTVHSAKESSASSFYVNTNPKQSNTKYNDLAMATRSPKSSENWYLKQNGSSQMSINVGDKNRSVNLVKKIDDSSSDTAVDVYLNWLHGAFTQFQKTGNINTLKQINQQNSFQIKKLHQQLVTQKQSTSSTSLPKSNDQIPVSSSSSPRPYTPLNSQRLSQLRQQLSLLQTQSSQFARQITQQTQLAQQLQQQYQQQLYSRENNPLDQSHIRQSNHLKQMQESIIELQEEIKTLERKNNQLAKGIGGLPFFKQWSIMFDEAKGATKLNLKLKHQIAKRQQLIKDLTNQDPSNNSDARSVRRIPSQNGQKPSNFKKQPAKSIPTSFTKPHSQLPHKFNQKPDSSRSNDVVIRHLSHSNRFSQSKKTTVNNSVDKTKERKQSYDQKPYPQNKEWKNMAFPQNLKNIGLNFIGKDVYK